MNKVLLLSVGRKVALINCLRYLVHDIEIIGCDSQSEVTSSLFLDDFFTVDKYLDLNINDFLETILQKKVQFIIPTSDLDLLFLSKHKDLFLRKGVKPMVSKEESILCVNDKLQFYTKIHKEISTIPTFNQYIPGLYNKWVIKPRYGSASKGVYLNIDELEVKMLENTLADVIYQPYIKGTEYSVDLYLSSSEELIAILVRTRENVENGESQKTTIINHKKIEEVSKKFVEIIRFTGHIMLQYIETLEGEVYLMECNARIGGASTASMYAGLNSVKWFVEDIEAIQAKKLFKENKKIITQYRYQKDKIL